MGFQEKRINELLNNLGIQEPAINVNKAIHLLKKQGFEIIEKDINLEQMIKILELLNKLINQEKAIIKGGITLERLNSALLLKSKGHSLKKKKVEFAEMGTSGRRQETDSIFSVKLGRNEWVFKRVEDVSKTQLNTKLKDRIASLKKGQSHLVFMKDYLKKHFKNLRKINEILNRRWISAKREYKVNEVAREKGVNTSKGVIYKKSLKPGDSLMGFKKIKKSVDLKDVVEQMINKSKSKKRFWKNLGKQVGLLHRKHSKGRVIHGDLGGCGYPINKSFENIIVKDPLIRPDKPYFIDFEFGEVLETKKGFPRLNQWPFSAIDLAINEALTIIFNTMNLIYKKAKVVPIKLKADQLKEIARKAFTNYIKSLYKTVDKDYQKALKKLDLDFFVFSNKEAKPTCQGDISNYNLLRKEGIIYFDFKKDTNTLFNLKEESDFVFKTIKEL